MIRKKTTIVIKIEKLHREYEPLKKGRYRRSEAQTRKKRILRYFSTTSSTWHTGSADHDDQPGGQEFLLAQREPGRRGRMGGVDSVLAPSGKTRQSLRLEKPLFSPPENKKRLPLPICGALESSPSSSSNTSAVVSDEEYGAFGRSESCEAGETGHEEHRLSSTGGHAGSNQAARDRSATYVLTEAALCLGQNVEELKHQPLIHPTPRLETSCGHGLKDQRGVSVRNSAGGPLGWQARDGPDHEKHVDRLPIIISGIGGANCSPSPSWAVARERAWRQRWSRPWRHGDSRIR
ncbi:hypothetical protein GWK47_011406 [Chionoecetes opilio]|uniref:Uncharacterized protein n=1 Tax=Chionoecetes opilio TaxID=41210 RepID=A0A8J4XXW9_CHIOP|nr:hypothetical protein GWK47_011406 [Chionoecetes opilio]